MRTVPTRRRLASLLGAATLALTLAACAEPLPEPTPEPEPASPEAALDVAQVERVLADVRAVLDAADEAQDATLLEPRVVGPALTVRKAEYVLADDGTTEGITPIPTQVQTVVVPATVEWPRVVMAVTEPPEDLRPPLLVTLVQESPRDQFKLWSWVRLFAGVQMPATLQPEIGSEPVAVDDDALVLPPGEVLPAYVDLLAKGDESAFAAQFPADPLRTGIVETKAAYGQLVEGKGALSETYEVVQGEPLAIRTADGGALVVGAFVTTTVITLSDSTLTLGDETASLLGATTVKQNLAIAYMSTVAFHVPPAAEGARVGVLGAEHVPIAVSGQ